jgi:hypothetical protein
MVPLGDMQYSTGPGIGAWLGVSHRWSSMLQLVGHAGALVGSELICPGISDISDHEICYFVRASDCHFRRYSLGERLPRAE